MRCVFKFLSCACAFVLTCFACVHALLVRVLVRVCVCLFLCVLCLCVCVRGCACVYVTPVTPFKFGLMKILFFSDRGPNGPEVICVLFSFVALFPQTMFLNRGNHESRSMNARYSFEDQVLCVLVCLCALCACVRTV